MYKIPANTVFIGKNLISVPECHSTNVLAAQMSAKADVPEGTIIITDHQTAGKGQRGNVWVSEQHMNLTFSLVLRPHFLRAQDQFQLNIAIALGLADVLTRLVGESAVRIKWPNDLLINNKKVCGVLIENQIKGAVIVQSIVGIGLNVNQQTFSFAQASSLANELQTQLDLADVLNKLLEKLEVRYLQLRAGHIAEMHAAYTQQLYQRHEAHQFANDEGSFVGTIDGVDDAGRLRITRADGEQLFSIKEVRYLD